MKLGVIASMKKGLEHFVYREVSALAAQGHVIELYPTKMGHGLYHPPADWTVRRWRVAAVLLAQLTCCLARPRRYLVALVEAVRLGAVPEFSLAAYFARWGKDVDVLYATFGDRKLYVGYFLKQLTKKPLAVTIHAYELYDNPNPRMFPVALAACDRIMTVSEYNRELLAQRYGVPVERVELVRLSIDLDEYRPAKKFVVLIVAFFVPKKGHKVLFEAVRQMKRDDVEVWVVGGDGGDDDKVDVPQLAREKGIADQVAFFGKLSGPALKAVYHACDVFCLPSRHDENGMAEGFPTVLIEAMACGKPVVTTRHVEIPRIVEQVLVDENNPRALAEALQHVASSQSLRDELGERNRQLAERHFSLRNSERLGELLVELTPDGRAAVPKVDATTRAAATGETVRRNAQPATLADSDVCSRVERRVSEIDNEKAHAEALSSQRQR